MKTKQPESAGRRRQIAHPSVLLGLLPMFLVMVLAGCKQDARVAADANPVGTYALVSVDGNKVPCNVQHEGHALGVKSGSFIINANGSCTSKMVLAGRDSAIEVKATYTRQGSQLTMQWEGAGMTVGTVEGDTFTMTNEGMIFAYRK
ncbi:MAG: hypothetical protein KGS61_19965 [Verrucomicrobia bacterium]|nr:hypothetical protein [Verrucomicrobiota bacterium]